MLVYLLAVHHVPEAGQRVNPDVNVFMLNSPHGQLQHLSQVTAAGCQLEGISILPFRAYFIVSANDVILSHR